MSSLYTLLLISLVLGPGGYAGPACVHRQWGSVDECASACGARWGWPGAAMGTDPWGAVIHQVALDTDMDAIVRQACADALAVITSSSGATLSASAPPSLLLTMITSLATTPVFPTAAPSSSTVFLSFPPVSPITSISSTSNSAFPMPDNTATRTVETAITATQTSPGPASSTGISRTGPVDQEVYLTAHNNARVAHGAQPLTWSFTLADAAQRWADRCMFAPSRGELGQFGENLAAVSDADGPAEIVGSWIAERTRFDAANPEAEGTGRFTQVVWKATDQVGCASSPCDGILNGIAHFHVCEYHAPGNVIGQYAQNVQA